MLATLEIEMMHIPAGEFVMGDARHRSEEPDTRPAHAVLLDTFWLASTPVTVEQFRVFVRATGYKTMAEQRGLRSWEDYARGATPDHPVSAVNWLDAQAFCRWARLRLPTEAEWEKAAQGGLEEPEFPWGEGAADAWCNWRHSPRRPKMLQMNGLGGTTPVRSYPPNAYGLYDMAGNVWEWVEDVYRSDYYQHSPAASPPGPEQDEYGRPAMLRRGEPNPECYRVARGGGFENVNFGLRCCERIFARASTTNKPEMSGFRVASSRPPDR